jgi:streptogramin lyase
VRARVPVASAYGIWSGAGSVWTLRLGGADLVRVDLRSRARGGAPARDPRTRSVALAFGAGAAWVADHGDGGVYRVDSATGHAALLARVGGTPISIAFAGGAVWVTGPQLGRVRVEPATGAARTVAPLGAGGGIRLVADGPLVYAVGADAGGGLAPARLVRVDAWSGDAATLELPAAARRGTAAGLAAAAGRLWLLDGSTGRLVRLPR